MTEIHNTIPVPDMSDILSTYKTHPTATDDTAPRGLICKKEGKNTSREDAIQIPKCATFFEKTLCTLQIISKQGLTWLEALINGCVKMAKVGAWCIAIFGSLFIMSLATNTIDRAVEILNINILSRWGKSIDIGQKTISEDTSQESNTKTTNSLKSSALGTTQAETPEMIAKKRAALLEARKTARIEQEKLKSAEKTLTQ
ncbi:MAG: hypothetical protein WC753_01005 [Candidatus Gracilibacteria bacterium]